MPSISAGLLMGGPRQLSPLTCIFPHRSIYPWYCGPGRAAASWAVQPLTADPSPLCHPGLSTMPHCSVLIVAVENSTVQCLLGSEALGEAHHRRSLLRILIGICSFCLARFGKNEKYFYLVCYII
uniref:Uncharacterized protein n=1 Tax=Myotis myotis TaxID=51298 RepID=A0A7J7V3N5_MYOMY|nr:hypothetical protein mMyoMyo1_008433 [Myotis myotis]